MPEKQQTFRSFEELPSIDSKDENPEPKREKKAPDSKERLLLSQMGLINEKLEIVMNGSITKENFFQKAIETGWNNNPNKKSSIAFWGPTVLEAYKLYFKVDDKQVNRDLKDIIDSRSIIYIPTNEKAGYMLALPKKED